MSIVISAERAVASGLFPEDLVVVAIWHEERAELIEASLSGGKKKRRLAGTPDDIRRHKSIARELRSVAKSVSAMMQKVAA